MNNKSKVVLVVEDSLLIIERIIGLLSEADNIKMVIHAAKQTRRGIGLSNIYERTKFYDGTVSIRTAPGKGCKVIVMIPCIDQ